MYLVMGITGKVGGATARHLLAKGKQVRALVRDREKAANWANQGVEIVDGDWNDAAAIAQALQGVEGAFVMLPSVWAPSPDFKESKEIISTYTKAFAQTAPLRLVALSSMGADKVSGLGTITPLSLMEQAFRELKFPVAFVRAGGFYENFLHALQTSQEGTLAVFYDKTDRKLPMVATEDIGAEITKLLTGPIWDGRRVIELGSFVNSDELAAQLGEVIGREVKAQTLPREIWASVLEQMGVPQGQTQAAEQMLDAVNSGWIAFGAPDAKHVEGTTSARDVFASAKAAAKD